MKKMIAIMAVVIAAVTYAETAPFDFHTKPKDEAERQARKEYMQKRSLEYSGGLIMRPNTQAGEIVYVNCQKSADAKWLEESAEYFVKETKFKVSVKEGAFNFAKPEIQGNMSIFIIEDAAMPSLLIAPEARWALVNVAPLKTDKVAFFQARVRKELTRAFAMLCGGANSKYPQALTGGITKVGDLDQIAELRLPVDVIQRMSAYMAPFGVRPAAYATYRKACADGWAPQPTNDNQRVIWEEYHAKPTEPMTIKFDPKKGM